MKRYVRVYAACAALLMAAAAMAQSDDRTRVFNAPMDRVWAVAKSNLKSLGWDVDKEDREVGWMVTDSRRLEGDDFGVYAKGTKHRLRLMFKSLDSGKKTSVTVERKVWKNERILWMDKDEDLPTTDHRAETQLLDAIGNSL
jgi:hypothetical protein